LVIADTVWVGISASGVERVTLSWKNCAQVGVKSPHRIGT